MIHDLSKYQDLPVRGKISWTAALMKLKVKSWKHYIDWDCSRKAKGHWSKKKAKNSKAKHIKKFKRLRSFIIWISTVRF